MLVVSFENNRAKPARDPGRHKWDHSLFGENGAGQARGVTQEPTADENGRQA